jgi:hypothetical protein
MASLLLVAFIFANGVHACLAAVLFCTGIAATAAVFFTVSAPSNSS